MEPDTLPKAKYILTTRGYEQLRKELEELQRRRGEVAGNIRTAKGFGDLSENFEYHEARREQGFVEGRIIELREIIPNARVVRPEEVDAKVVSFGAVVRVKDLDAKDEWEIAIVGPLEADPEEDCVSYESPLGAALMGKKVGDKVETQVPAGTLRYQVKAIRPYEI